MKILVNGKNESFDIPSLNIEQMLEFLGHAKQRVAVEKNGAIVTRADYSKDILKDADRIEIITLVGGG